jgi:hypothetical protein
MFCPYCHNQLPEENPLVNWPPLPPPLPPPLAPQKRKGSNFTVFGLACVIFLLAGMFIPSAIACVCHYLFKFARNNDYL